MFLCFKRYKILVGSPLQHECLCLAHLFVVDILSPIESPPLSLQPTPGRATHEMFRWSELCLPRTQEMEKRKNKHHKCSGSESNSP